MRAIAVCGNTMNDESDRCLWQHYEFIEHLVRLAKAQAMLKLQQSA